MKKKIIIVGVIIILIIGIILALLFLNRKYPYEDENTLYSIEFKNEIIRYERYDYSLGQNQIVGVQKSTNKGKSFENITEEPIILSMEPKLIFLNEKLGFAIAKPNLTKSNDYMGFKVTQDGGKSFTNSKINYDNPNIDILTIESTPYFEDNILKVKCSIYQVKEDQSGYEDKELIFISKDEGLTWDLENKDNELISERRKNLDSLIKNEMINKQFLDKNNLKSYKITSIYIYGYYTDDKEKKYMQINFNALCNDNSRNCVNNCYYDEKDNEYIKWIVTDEKTIFEFKSGVSISLNDVASEKFIMVGEEIK